MRQTEQTRWYAFVRLCVPACSAHGQNVVPSPFSELERSVARRGVGLGERGLKPFYSQRLGVNISFFWSEAGEGGWTKRPAADRAGRLMNTWTLADTPIMSSALSSTVPITEHMRDPIVMASSLSLSVRRVVVPGTPSASSRHCRHRRRAGRTTPPALPPSRHCPGGRHRRPNE